MSQIMRTYLKITLVVFIILVIVSYFGISFLSHYGHKNPEAMSDGEVEQYVKEHIPIHSSESTIKTFIEKEKEKFPYYSIPSSSSPYYILQYANGNYKLWIGGYNHCDVFVYLDEDNRVSKIKLRRTISPLL